MAIRPFAFSHEQHEMARLTAWLTKHRGPHTVTDIQRGLGLTTTQTLVLVSKLMARGSMAHEGEA